jgi:hypothetical protein
MEKLIFKEQELEARLGFEPGKFTNPNKSLSFICALLLTVTFYVACYFAPSTPSLDRVIALFTERGFIPYVTTFAFLWGTSLVWFKARKINTQLSALHLLLRSNFGCYHFSPDNAVKWQEWLRKKADVPQDYILLNRLRTAFSTLGNMGHTESLHAIINSHSENDEYQVDGSYSFINMLLYTLPILGFIGTVLGLGAAIGGFGETLSVGAENINGLIRSLQGVTGGLSVAFDTTLLALVLTLILQIYASFARARETIFLEDCNYFMQNEFFINLRNRCEPDEEFPWSPIRKK